MSLPPEIGKRPNSSEVAGRRVRRKSSSQDGLVHAVNLEPIDASGQKALYVFLREHARRMMRIEERVDRYDGKCTVAMQPRHGIVGKLRGPAKPELPLQRHGLLREHPFEIVGLNGKERNIRKVAP